MGCLIKVLERVKTGFVSRSEFAEWMKKEFKLTGRWSPRWYAQCFFDLGLVKESEGGVRLSEIGEEFLMTKDTKLILDILLEKFAGVRHILIVLSEKNGANLNAIHQLLEEAFTFGWKTSSQTRIRLRWLISLGYVRYVKGKYFLENKGREVLMEERVK